MGQTNCDKAGVVSSVLGGVLLPGEFFSRHAPGFPIFQSLCIEETKMCRCHVAKTEGSGTTPLSAPNLIQVNIYWRLL